MMKYKCLLSIIIPVYNVSPYLKRCLISIKEQTLSDFEAIIVDDASTDDSGFICDQFASIDSRFKVIHKQINEGLSEARNTALTYVNGEYIAFVDSDDYVHPQMYEIMYRNIKKNNCTLAICNFIKTESSNYNFKINKHSIKTHTIDVDQFIIGPYWDLYYSVVWNKLYKRELIDGILFRKDVYAEDQFYNVQVFRRNPSVICCDFIGIVYFQRSDSIVHTDKEFKKIEWCNFPLMNYNSVKELCETNETRFKLLWNMMLIMAYLKGQRTPIHLISKKNSIINNYKNSLLVELNQLKDVPFTKKYVTKFLVKYPIICDFLSKIHTRIHIIFKKCNLFL